MVIIQRGVLYSLKLLLVIKTYFSDQQLLILCCVGVTIISQTLVFAITSILAPPPYLYLMSAFLVQLYVLLPFVGSNLVDDIDTLLEDFYLPTFVLFICGPFTDFTEPLWIKTELRFIYDHSLIDPFWRTELNDLLQFDIGSILAEQELMKESKNLEPQLLDNED